MYFDKGILKHNITWFSCVSCLMLLKGTSIMCKHWKSLKNTVWVVNMEIIMEPLRDLEYSKSDNLKKFSLLAQILISL